MVQEVHDETPQEFLWEHFYASTIDKARAACLEHGKAEHPDWGSSACFCPD